MARKTAQDLSDWLESLRREGYNLDQTHLESSYDEIYVTLEGAIGSRVFEVLSPDEEEE